MQYINVQVKKINETGVWLFREDKAIEFFIA